MAFSFDLFTEALLFGVLLGCFYAAVSIGLSVSFGLLDVPHVAHPAIMVLGSYCTYVVASHGLDPILAGVVLMPVFFVRGLAFFFGIAFIIEVGLILVFGVDQRTVQAQYIGSSLALGEYRIPYRMLVAFGIATGVSALAGAMLIIVGPVEPALDRVYIGRTFCVVVLAGVGSMTGTLASGLILGISESIVLMFFGASWAPAVAFGLLLVVLGIRPQGLFGR